MPAIPRQLLDDLSEAIQSRFFTVSVDLLGPTLGVVQPSTTTQDLLPSITLIPGLTISSVQATPALTIVFTSSIAPVTTTTTSATPTTTSVTSTTPILTSVETVPTSSSSSSSSSSSLSSALLPPTTPAASNDPDVIASTSAVVVTQSRSASATATATGVSSNADSTQADVGLGSGIIALIVIGALLGVLLAGAFVFRRVQVRRRAKRRGNHYGSPASDDAPFPFTNVSEADLKGAQPVRDPMVNYEKPLPSIIPDAYPALPDPTYNQYGQYGDNRVSGHYPTMGGAAMDYGYEQHGRTSPGPSQVQALRITSPSPPPVAYAPSSYTYPNPLPQAPTPAPAPSVPASFGLAVPQIGSKKRVIQTFQPTLPDELDIQEGDWVSVIHAYDDGWGMCECNGRRGVVPLECLDPGKPDFRASRRFSSLSAIRQ